jgi:DNA polymerase (family 10)
MKNEDVVRLLSEIGDMLEVEGESPFKVRAYRDAARRLEGMPESIADLVAEGRLTQIRGVGASIAEKITEFVETGRSTYHDELESKLSSGFVKMLQIPGVGPKMARLFRDELGLSSIEELEEAAKSHRLRDLPHVGEKAEANVLAGIERLRHRSGRMLLGTALPVAEEIVGQLRDHPAVERIETCGSLRRWRETIGDIDVLVASTRPADALEAFASLPIVKSVLAKGTTKASVLTEEDLQVDCRVVSPDEWGAALQYFTGSKDHNVQIRSIAETNGLKVNEYGVFRTSDDCKVAGPDEEGVYRVLGMPWIPPEIREAHGEVEAALEGRLPDLIELSDIRGDLHIHTNWSDGHNSIEEMAEAAIAHGYEYLSIADHSVGMGFISGLTVERILEQRRAIDQINEQYDGFRVLQGIEVNIRADGTLDYDDDVLARFDIVTASIHGGLAQTEERITERMLSAIHNPHVDIIGHPTGRIIDKREPSAFDEPAVFAAAAETHTALEINAQPDRLDLKDTHARRAMEAGALIAIDSDAHSTGQLQLVRYGTATARRGWVTKGRVVNALPLKELLAWLDRNR